MRLGDVISFLQTRNAETLTIQFLCNTPNNCGSESLIFEVVNSAQWSVLSNMPKNADFSLLSFSATLQK